MKLEFIPRERGIYVVIDCKWNFNPPGFINPEVTFENSDCGLMSFSVSFRSTYLLSFGVLDFSTQTPFVAFFWFVNSLELPAFNESTIILVKTNLQSSPIYHYH